MPTRAAFCRRTCFRAITKSSASSSCSARCCGSWSAGCWRWAFAGNWRIRGPMCPMLGQAAARSRGRPDRARNLHDAVHDARHGDDLPGDHPDSGRGVRQLSDPADDRRRRHGLPHAQHVELLVHVAGVHCVRRRASLPKVAAPARAGPAITPLSLTMQRASVLADRPVVRRRLLDDGLGELSHHDHPDARPRHDDVPPADDDLGHVHHRHPAGLRAAGAHGGRLHAAGRHPVGHRLFHSRRLEREQRGPRQPAAASRCCGSTCSGSTATRPCTS